ncbi:hypothetical protein CANCADRAFT_119225 [Tortispora caseinolytica NRRL Y-17796]|uniref:Zinc finger PHD-type domain-containing protein n=1 Tax=Tortispora caseinolytica NRRL Y-17796 TaxID=767744 RepID=A0A1E4THF1_9ASCO|nr:hypothetical protein CANCADRAFT_119225 [Tortispora caseinolytica NRRL Y-17796]
MDEYHQNLAELRNMWEFSALFEWLFLFRSTIRIKEDIEVEDLEDALLGQHHKAEIITKVHLGLVRNLAVAVTPESLDLITFRTISSKCPQLAHILHVESEHSDSEDQQPSKPAYKSLVDLDPFDRTKILHALANLQMANPDKFRKLLEEAGSDSDEIEWRMDPVGWDKNGASYILLDDNRLYRFSVLYPERPFKTRREKTPPQRATRSAKNQKTTRSSRRSTRIIHDESSDSDSDPYEDSSLLDLSVVFDPTWEVICITYDDWSEFLSKLSKSKHPDERAMHKFLSSRVMPIIEEAEQKRLKAEQAREKARLQELLIQNRKRSSRVEQLKQREEEAKQKAEEEAQRRAEMIRQRRQKEMERRKNEELRIKLAEREVRLEQRQIRLLKSQAQALKERLSNRESASLEPDAPGPARPQRARRAARDKAESKIYSIASSKSWIFDCSCGVYGRNYDDGELSVCCGRCEVWEHVRCVPEQEREKILHASNDESQYEYICESCKKYNSMTLEEQAKILEDLELEEQRKIEAEKAEQERIAEEARQAEEAARLAKEKRQAKERAKYVRRRERMRLKRLEEQRSKEMEAAKAQGVAYPSGGDLTSGVSIIHSHAEAIHPLMNIANHDALNPQNVQPSTAYSDSRNSNAHLVGVTEVASSGTVNARHIDDSRSAVGTSATYRETPATAIASREPHTSHLDVTATVGDSTLTGKMDVETTISPIVQTSATMTNIVPQVPIEVNSHANPLPSAVVQSATFMHTHDGAPSGAGNFIVPINPAVGEGSTINGNSHRVLPAGDNTALNASLGISNTGMLKTNDVNNMSHTGAPIESSKETNAQIKPGSG